ncbi:MAG TPA: PQQ-binding-like beta-propeller repeat protein [Humisphaera sp.]
MTPKLPRTTRSVLAAVALAAAPVAASVAAPAGGATAASTAPAAAVAVAAATQPLTALDGNWPAFHGGGELRGEGKAIGASPLRQRWLFKPDEPGAVQGSAAIVGQSVYVGDAKGRLYCLNLADGTPKWTYTVKDGSFEASPLVLDGRVYIGDASGVFHCVDAEKGTKVWTYDAGDGQPIHASANAWGGRVVFGNDGSDVICLNAADGTKAWQVSTGDRVNGAPAIGNGLAFVSGCDAKLHAIDVATGKEKYATELGNIAPGSPAVLPDRTVVGLDQGRVVAVAADGSKTLWEYKDVKDGAMVYASPAVADGVVVVGARDRQVHAINAADGTKKWTFGTRGDVDSSPAVAGGRVYVGSRDKKLYVLDLQTGKSLGDFQAARAIEAPPAIGQGVVVIGDTSGGVYCLEPK